MNLPKILALQLSTSDNIFCAAFFSFLGILWIIQILPKYDPVTSWRIARSYKNNFLKQEFRNIKVSKTEIKIATDSYREKHAGESYIKFVDSPKIFLLYYEKE